MLVRTAAAATCARLDFSIDRLEDVRLAVDEVAAMLIADVEPGADLLCEFLPLPDSGLEITMSARTLTGTMPRTDTFAWAVITALVDNVAASVDGQLVSVLLRTSASTSPSASANTVNV